jgi:hypothetical protein
MVIFLIAIVLVKLGDINISIYFCQVLTHYDSTLLYHDWLVHYNFLRPHESLDNKIPAEVAGVKYPYRNWQDIVAKGIIFTPKAI